MGIPVNRLLVPDGPPAAPPGFDVVMQPLVRGLPAELRLDAALSLIVFAPTGDANLWRDADPSVVVCAGDDELAPVAAPTVTSPLTSRPPLRLVLERAGVFVAAVPLNVGVRRHLPETGVLGSTIELIVLDYRIHAGTVRQAGDFGSFVRFAWRRSDRAVNEFRLPPLPPRVAERFAGRVQSEVGVPPPEEDK
jgi:hypothetical protein